MMISSATLVDQVQERSTSGPGSCVDAYLRATGQCPIEPVPIFGQNTLDVLQALLLGISLRSTGIDSPDHGASV